MRDHPTPNRQAVTRLAYGFALGAAALSMATMASADNYKPQPGQSPMQADSDQSFFAKTMDYVKNNTYGRLGVLRFQYYGSSTNLHVDDAKGLAAQSFGKGASTLHDTGSSAGNLTTLGGMIGMYLPKTHHHLAVEVQLAPPLKLDFQLDKRAAHESLAPTAVTGAHGDPIPTGVPAIGKNIGTFKALPPNFTLVFRPWTETRIQPYIGAGAMYLYTYDKDVSNKVLNEYNEPTLSLSKPVACVGQLGADLNLPKNMFLNADVKYVGCADVKARLNNIKIDAPKLSGALGKVDVGSVSSTNHFRAVLYQISFGMHF